MNIQLTQSGLNRRMKRHLLKETLGFFAITTPGFEEALEEEVRSLPGATINRRVTGGVEFNGPLELAYHADLRLRTANRIVMRVADFTARSYPELYNKAKRLPWELFVGFTKQITVESASAVSRLHHTDNIAETVFVSCRDHLAALGVVVKGTDDAPLRFLVRLADDQCTISIDASGPMLYKRGYRREIGHAPIRETLAAGMLLLAGWQKFPIIADPLCGSGTMLIEAALLACNKQPGTCRTFAFHTWPCFLPTMWERLCREAAEAVETTGSARPMPKLIGSDLSDRAIAAAKTNAWQAGVADRIVFTKGDCLEFNRNRALGLSGLLLSNLPYGKRAFASGEELTSFLRRWGAHLRATCGGWEFGFVTGDRNFSRAANLPVRETLQFTNGGLDVYFVRGTVPRLS